MINAVSTLFMDPHGDVVTVLSLNPTNRRVLLAL
jgi:hypothetical protein